MKKTFFLFLLIVFVTISFVGCNNQTPSKEQSEPQYIRESFKNGRSLEVKVDKSLTRDNWECTDDCSGHNAGYEWAEENEITDPEECSGKSQSFIEGCEAYANEN